MKSSRYAGTTFIGTSLGSSYGKGRRGNRLALSLSAPACVKDCASEKRRLRACGFFRPDAKETKTGHITHTGIERPFRVVRKAAKLPKELVLYSARHSFATDLLDGTGNLKLVMDVLGHESVTTTQKYLHPSLKNIAAYVNERNKGRAADATAA